MANINPRKIAFALCGFLSVLFILLIVSTGDVSAVGYGWVNAQDITGDCGNGLSKVSFATRRRDNDSQVNAGNIVGEVHQRSDAALVARVSGSITTGVTGCVYDPWDHYISLSVDGGGGYLGLGTWFITDPSFADSLKNKNITYHVHVQPDSESGSPAISLVSPISGWINSDPNVVVNVQSLVSAHGASAVTAIYLQISGPSSVVKTIPGSWPPGNISLGSQGLADGWYDWAIFANDNLPNFSASAHSQFQSFGLDRVAPFNVSAGHTPASPSSSDNVQILGHGEDALSGLDFMQVRVDGGLKSTCDFNGQFSGDCNPSVGTYAAGSTHNYTVRACDLSGNCKDATGSFSVSSAASPSPSAVPTPPPPTACVTLYENVNYGGGKKDINTEFTPDFTSLVFDNNAALNDNASSIVIKPGATVHLWRDPNYGPPGGTAADLTSSTADFTTLTYPFIGGPVNNSASSMRAVDCAAPTPTPTPVPSPTPTPSPGTWSLSAEVFCVNATSIKITSTYQKPSGKAYIYIVTHNETLTDLAFEPSSGTADDYIDGFSAGATYISRMREDTHAGSNPDQLDTERGFDSVVAPDCAAAATPTPTPGAGGGTIFGYKWKDGPFGTDDGNPPGATVTIDPSGFSDPPASGIYWKKPLAAGDYTVASSGVAKMVVHAEVRLCNVCSWSVYADSAAGDPTSVLVPVADNNVLPSEGGIGEVNVWFHYKDVAVPTPTPTPAALPNLVVSSVTTDKPSYVAGESMTITIEYKNASSTIVNNLFKTAFFKTGATTQPACGAVGDAFFTTTSMGANVTATKVFTIPAPASPGTHKAGAYIDSDCAVSESVEGTAGVTTNGDNFLPSANYTVVAAPTNLSVAMPPGDCASGLYSVTFSWSNNASNWTIDVEGSAPWGDGSFGDNIWLASKSVASGTSTTGPAGFNKNLSFNHFAPGVTYSWRIFYGITDTWANGPNFSMPLCPDLNLLNNVNSQFDFYGTPADRSNNINPKTSFGPGDMIYVRVKTANEGGDITTSFKIGFYIDRLSQGDPNSTCNPAPTPPDPLGTEKSPTIPFVKDAVDTWDFEVPAPATGGFKKAYVFADYTCALLSTEPDRADNIRSKTYSVNVDAWFMTVHGDAGSKGNIFFDTLPPDVTSTYLIAGGGNLANTVSGPTTWKLKTYDRKLLSAAPYNYLAARFRSKATQLSPCSLAAAAGGIYYCVGPATFSGSGPVGTNVIFIDGDLTISGDLTLGGAGDAVIFLASGNITVNTGVKQIDGIYVAREVFTDVDTSGSAGGRLTVNGGVLAGAVNLARILGAPGCSSDPGPDPCNNDASPAEVFNFLPKYLDQLNKLLGSAAISWREINP